MNQGEIWRKNKCGAPQEAFGQEDLRLSHCLSQHGLDLSIWAGLSTRRALVSQRRRLGNTKAKSRHEQGVCKGSRQRRTLSERSPESDLAQRAAASPGGVDRLLGSLAPSRRERGRG